MISCSFVFFFLRNVYTSLHVIMHPSPPVLTSSCARASCKCTRARAHGLRTRLSELSDPNVDHSGAGTHESVFMWDAPDPWNQVLQLWLVGHGLCPRFGLRSGGVHCAVANLMYASPKTCDRSRLGNAYAALGASTCSQRAVEAGLDCAQACV